MSGPVITAPMVLGLRGPGLTAADQAVIAAAAGHASDAQAAAAAASGTSVGAINRALSATRNLFDRTVAQVDHAVATDGSVQAGSGYTATGLLQIGLGGTFTANQAVFGDGGGYGIAFYDPAGAFVSARAGVAAGTAVALPATAAFARFAVTNEAARTLHVSLGSAAPTAYRSFELSDRYVARGDTTDRLAEVARRQPNLFDPSQTVTGYLNTSDGTIIAGPSYVTTGRMPVVGGRSYVTNKSYAGGTGYVWLDYQGGHIAGANGFTAGAPLVAPQGAAYLRLSFDQTGNDAAYGPSAPTAATLTVVEGTGTPAFRAAGYADDGQAAARGAQAVRAAGPAVVSLYDRRRAMPGLLSVGGAIDASASGYDVTDYIPVTAGGIVVASLDFVPGNAGYGWNWYDRDRQRIGATAGGFSANVGVPVPAGAVYGRVSYATAAPYRERAMLTITDKVLTAGDVVLGWDDVLNGFPWAGKAYATLGDSIEQSSAAGGLDYMQTVTARLMRARLGYAAGVAGRKMREVLNGAPASSPSGSSQNPAAQADFAGIDLAKIAVGVNDFGLWNGSAYAGGRPIGTLGDPAGAGTFYGDMQGIVGDKLLAWNPRMRVAMTTPYQTFQDGGAGNPVNDIGLHLSDYADAIIAFCRSLGLPCLDLHRVSGINRYTQATYLGDKLHPNALGYLELLCPQIAKWLGTLR